MGGHHSPLHATAIALGLDEDGPLAGVLILGPSGAGKSSLALASIEGCPHRRTSLIADDAVIIEERGGRAFASAPPRLQGLIEVRGLGPAPVRRVSAAPLIVVVDLGAPAARIVSVAQIRIAGACVLPVFPFLWIGAEASATHRLRVIVRQVLCGQIGEDPQDTRP